MEPMLLGSPSSPTSSPASTTLPSFLFGDLPTVAPIPTSVTRSRPADSPSSKHQEHPSFIARRVNSMSPREQRKVGAPPVIDLEESLSSPYAVAKRRLEYTQQLDDHSGLDSSVNFFNIRYRGATPLSNGLSNGSTNLGSPILRPGPIARSRMNADTEDEGRWVTVFGLPDNPSNVLLYFLSLGKVLEHRAPKGGSNWMNIKYANASAAERAVALNGELVAGSMVGVKFSNDAALKEASLVTSNGSKYAAVEPSRFNKTATNGIRDAAKPVANFQISGTGSEPRGSISTSSSLFSTLGIVILSARDEDAQGGLGREGEILLIRISTPANPISKVFRFLFMFRALDGDMSRVTWDAGEMLRVRVWDLMILIPNCLFLIFLMVTFPRAKLMLRATSSPIFFAFYVLVVVNVFVSIVRCVVSMSVNAAEVLWDDVDKVLWILLRFFLLSTELSVITFGLAFAKRSFYGYVLSLAMLNLCQSLGSLFVLSSSVFVLETAGLCVVDITTYLYFILLTPLVYRTFLKDIFAMFDVIASSHPRSPQPGIMFSYKPYLDDHASDLESHASVHMPHSFSTLSSSVRSPSIDVPDAEVMNWPDQTQMNQMQTPGSINPLYGAQSTNVRINPGPFVGASLFASVGSSVACRIMFANKKKKKLFCDKEEADPSSEFQINEDYAGKYDSWRKAEEKQKLLARYGDTNVGRKKSGELDDAVDDFEDSDESESEQEEYDEPEADKAFLRALSALKSKDPRIYDANVKFVAEPGPSDTDNTTKQKTKKPMFLKDYERHIITEKGGHYSDEDEEDDEDAKFKRFEAKRGKTYVEEQAQLKKGLQKFVEDSDEDEEGSLLKVREKTKQEKEEEDADYRRWLKDNVDVELEDESLAKDLSGLRNYWSRNDIPEDEKFLKDYILNQRYKDADDDDAEFPTYEEIVNDPVSLSDDEEQIEGMTKFERKFNFRFEEPDEDFIKSYPRTVGNTVRKKDTRRRDKREEVKSRKEREKAEKREELNRLKELKREEIMERLSKIKEVSGNDQLALEDQYLEEDFDPDEHDRQMANAYGDDYYKHEGDVVGDEDDDDDDKPVFEYDEEIDGDIPDWDKWDPKNDDSTNGTADATEQDEKTNRKKKSKVSSEEHHYETNYGILISKGSENFIMDCDYDPTSEAHQAALKANRKKGKRKKKSLFSKAVERPKPMFDPVEMQFEEYFDEYYQLDFEDLIGDLPTRFKYRKVVPNDFGLSTEEILTAEDKELNRWSSLKKSLQYRRDEEERFDLNAYRSRAENVKLKQKLLPSLFEHPEPAEKPGSSKKNKKKESNSVSGEEDMSNVETATESVSKKKKKKRKSHVEETYHEDDDVKIPSESQELEEPEVPSFSNEVSPKKIKKKKKKTQESHEENANFDKPGPSSAKSDEKGSKKRPNYNIDKRDSSAPKKRKSTHGVPTKFEKPGFKAKAPLVNTHPSISDDRLKAFGLNPRKIRDKFKYGLKADA
ncbi:unnamed protein product [Notodromas monacha]|uniref:Nucleoporin NUP35 n=1 Tax=Notodromas monacha TaxID=399045 RepID=A0A7R9BQX6_9CRUS|nr:unnamed protein product [Notodromas monacha]CAG0920056.1 unnamed protein product [Notodromas monacha]